jgi:hypothetical protein
VHLPPIKPDVSRYKYLAHARHVNMAGMPGSVEDDIEFFSVVMAHRTGPWDSFRESNMIAHLVSIERIRDHMTLSFSQPLVALCSLYSWTYTVLPRNSLNLYDAMRWLGSQNDVLRAPGDVFHNPRCTADPVALRVGQRMQDGYTIVRHRVLTGETTAALMRGPFVPTAVPAPLSETWTSQSTFSTDLQILDKALGMMDITYSIAWQLGKTMGIADMAFASALTRYRSTIYVLAMERSSRDVLHGDQLKFALGKRDVVKSISKTIEKLGKLPAELASGEKSSPHPTHRWNRTTHQKHVDLSFWSRNIRTRFPAHAIKVAHELAKSQKSHPDGIGHMLYNEHNDPVNTDWVDMPTSKRSSKLKLT